MAMNHTLYSALICYLFILCCTIGFAQSEPSLTVSGLTRTKPTPPSLQIQQQIQQLEKELHIANDTAKVTLLNRLCWLYRVFDVQTAIQYGEEALALAGEHEMYEAHAQAANYTGVMYRNIGDFSRAMSLFLFAKQISEERHITHELGYAFNNIGDIHRMQKNFPLAVQFISRAKSIFEQNHDSAGIAYCLLRIGESYQFQQKHDTALMYFYQTLSIRERLGDTNQITMCYLRIAQVLRAQEQPYKALMVLEKALDLHTSKDEAAASSDIPNAIARTYLDLRAYPEAIQHALLGLERGQRLGAKQAIEFAASILSKSYAALGKYKAAHEYEVLHGKMWREVANEEVQRNIANEEIKHERSLRQKQVELLNKQKDYERSIRYGLTMGFSLLMVFVVLLIFHIRSQRRTNQSLFKQQAILLEHQHLLLSERQKSDSLLKNILPESIARRLKDNPSEMMIADVYENVTVLFADVVDFTVMTKDMPPQDVVTMLNKLFYLFDTISERYGAEKIKTIGDCYMVACGAPEPRINHATTICLLALDFLQQLPFINRDNTFPALSVRIGIHSGPVVAGIIGHKKFIYDLWGDTVNTASRLESLGEAGKIHISDTVVTVLQNERTQDLPSSKPEFLFEDRGEVEIKGIGSLHTYFLVGKV